jgi:excisionase family DNA binding protein
MSTLSTTLSNELLTPEEAAELLRTRSRTLERWRHTGTGPRFAKIGRRVVYARADITSWVSAQTRQHTGAA